MRFVCVYFENFGRDKYSKWGAMVGWSEFCKQHGIQKRGDGDVAIARKRWQACPRRMHVALFVFLYSTQASGQAIVCFVRASKLLCWRVGSDVRCRQAVVGLVQDGSREGVAGSNRAAGGR